jgi:hypothetical protein
VVKKIRIGVLIFCILATFALLFRGWGYFLPTYSWKAELSHDFSQGWEVETEGSEEKKLIDLPKDFEEVEAGQWITLKKHIPKEAADRYEQLCLMVGSSQQEILVKLGDTEIFHMEGMKKINFGRTSGMGWFLVPLPEDCGGMELSLSYTSSYKETAGAISPVHLGEKRELEHDLFLWSFWEIVAGVFLLFLSFSVLLAVLIQENSLERIRKSGIYLGLLLLDLSIFILVESQGSAFFFFNIALCYYGEFIALFTFMVFLYRFIYYFYDLAHKEVIWQFGNLHLFLFGLALLGQLTGIFDFFLLQWVLLGFFAATLLGTGGLILWERKNKKGSFSIFVWLLLLIILVGYYSFVFQKETEIETEKLLLKGIVAFCIYFIGRFFFAMRRLFWKEKENLLLREEIKQRIAYYEKLEENKKVLKKYCHDIKYQWFAVEKLLAGERFEEAKEYLCSLTGELQREVLEIDTGNYLLDGLLTEKLLAARELGAVLDWSVAVKKELPIAPGDCCALLGNLFDNSLEALEKVEKEKRQLRLRVASKQNLLLIKLENSYNGKVEKKGSHYLTQKREKEWHGIGLESVSAIVDSYRGSLEISYDDSRFCVGIALKL